MFQPIYVKANLSFVHKSGRFAYPSTNVSSFGASDLPWKSLDPDTAFGERVRIRLEFMAKSSAPIELHGTILRQETQRSRKMALRFEYDHPEQQRALEILISRYGFYPTDHVRKYPRIPSSADIPVYPLRVTGFMANSLDEDQQRPEDLFIFDVADISPNGILIHTENQNTKKIRPGQRLNLTLEPRGWFPFPVHVQGLICRRMDDLQNESGNPRHYFGIKFVRVDEINQEILSDLIKEIIRYMEEQEQGGVL